MTTYSYTPDQALASAHTPTASVSYTSDGTGLRQSRTQAGSTSQFTWSTQGQLPILLDDGHSSYLYGPSLTPVAQVDDTTSTIEYLHTDNLGSVRQITDNSGTVIGSTDFDAFGKRIGHTGTADSAVGYAGNWTDPTTGLIYLRARDYDPTTGQFLTVDPLVDSTLQPYAYTANSPLTGTDPSGLCWTGLGVNCHAASSANADLYHAMTHGARAHVVSAIEGFGDGASFGLSSKIDEAVSKGSTCTYAHDAWYIGANVGGQLTVTVATGGGGGAEALTGDAVREGEELTAREAARAGEQSAAESATSALPSALEGGPANVDVYLGVRDGKSVYTGISNNIERRALQHGDRFDQLRQVTAAPVTRGQARSIEQALITRNPGFENKINNISPNQPYYQQAVDWGNAWLDANGYP